ncbi:WXG100 family type VII secretion target, partial [Glycomyces dulcitolivorans]|uniref:WXG100 family type VII secretion target n=1 Tax=Glycomyces dulcitolivorans TaxID=2200759 RepID=UPI0018E5755C
MPTYQDALAADPSQFLAYATEMTSAAADLAAQQTDYGARVADINVHWRDTANDAFNGEVGTVNAHLTQVIGEITTTAGSLAAAGSQMLTECTLLKAADAALKVAGFYIQPAPMVTLGALQRTAIAMAGPFGGLIEAALQAQALAGTLGLQALTTLVNAADATAGAAVSAAADLLKPLEDKTGTGDESVHATAEDHSGGGSEESEEEESKEEEEEKKEEQGKEESPQSESQEPTSPETPSGMEGLAQPETPDLENPWDASELPDPDDLSGGLASGGGLGGGVGGGVGGAGLGAGGLGSGPGGAGVGAA